MKYKIVPSNRFKKNLQLAQKRGYDLDKIKKVITAVIVNATFSRTGCLCIKQTEIN